MGIFVFQLNTLVLVLGCIALPVAIGASRHWKYVFRDSLLNSALLIGFGLLMSPRSAINVLAFFPAALAAAISISSWAHSDLLANLGKPPRYVTLYPTRRRTLILLGFSVIVLVRLVMNWREQAYIQTAELLDVAAIEAVANQSLRATSYLKTLKTKSATPLQGHELIETCGSVLRLAELDGIRTTLPHPTDTICRAASTYRPQNVQRAN